MHRVPLSCWVDLKEDGSNTSGVAPVRFEAQVACKQSRPEYLFQLNASVGDEPWSLGQGRKLVFWKRCGLQTQVKLNDGVIAVDRTNLRRSLFRSATEPAGYYSAAQARAGLRRLTGERIRLCAFEKLFVYRILDVVQAGFEIVPPIRHDHLLQ